METSTRVKGDAEGLYIGLRRGNEQDGDAHDREISLVDFSARQASPDYTSPTRTVTSSDTTEYGTHFADLPTGISTTALTTGDKPTMVLSVHVANGTDPAGCVITPLILDSSDRVIGRLPPKYFEGFEGPGDSSPHFYYDDGDSEYYAICETMTWDVRGAEKVGIHVSGETNFTKAKIWAAMISGPPTDSLAAARSTSGSYTSSVTPAE